jgi:homeodomain-containing protein
MKATETLTMSARELDRLEILGRVAEKRLTQQEAARRLGLTVRQIERLARALREHGPAGLVSRKRGRTGNRKISDAVRQYVVGVVRSLYPDFGPTLALEKLVEKHNVGVSVETLRQWMIDEGLWKPRSQRHRRAHQPRHRRPCRGELVQIDGCDHAWFEDRGPKCTLLVYVDDATGSLMELRFAASESAFDYFASTRAYLEQHGKPVALYSDKASIFRVAAPKDERAGGVTQFGRALFDLNIDIICANTPQAKGRVERAHQTLQDRLVKELRLRGISTLEDGNAFLPAFREDFNERFGREPLSPHDAHRPVRDDEDLDVIFTWQEERKLSSNLTLNYKCVTWLIESGPDTLPLAGNRVRVYEDADGNVEIRHGATLLPSSPFFDKNPMVTQADIVENKRLGYALSLIQADQRKRDEQRLANRKLSLRQKQRIRAAREAADAIAT